MNCNVRKIGWRFSVLLPIPTTILLLVGIGGTFSSGFLHAAANFTPLGLFGGNQSFASDVSADGSVVVGISGAGGAVNNVFRWTASQSIDVPPTLGLPAVSADGSVIVGTYPVPGGVLEAFRWTVEVGREGLGDLPGGRTNSGASDVSADGGTVVGYGTPSFPDMPFPVVWGTSGSPSRLDGLGSGSALGVSADGGVVVGRAGGQAFRWGFQTGMVGLGFPPGATGNTAHSVSADGSVVVGVNFFPTVPPGSSNFHSEAFRWTAGEGLISLRDLPGGRVRSTAYDVSADGSVIVGIGETLGEGGESVSTAFYWSSATGMLNLRDVLVSAGATGLDGWTLTEARGVSWDGLTVVGTGIHDGVTEAFVATIPEPCTLVLAALAAAVLALRRRLQRRSGIVVA